MQDQYKDALELIEADHKKVKSLFKEFESLTDRSKVSKKRVADQICQELTIHAEMEEMIFYPAMRGVPGMEDLLDEALVEHSSAKDLISQLMGMDPEGELYDAKVKVLQEMIEHHVEEEEGDMFAKAKKSKVDLEALGDEMEAFKSKKMASV
ncbi:MAG TPA: hemerythrin domain-containing protein [Limnobacter sp.]|nr:hemerythrin domain-containing protein [Limnobacter sp.]